MYAQQHHDLIMDLRSALLSTDGRYSNNLWQVLSMQGWHGVVRCMSSATMLGVCEPAGWRQSCVCVVALCVQVYPIVVHWLWTQWGWLSPNNAKPLFGSGAMDFAGWCRLLLRLRCRREVYRHVCCTTCLWKCHRVPEACRPDNNSQRWLLAAVDAEVC